MNTTLTIDNMTIVNSTEEDFDDALFALHCADAYAAECEAEAAAAVVTSASTLIAAVRAALDVSRLRMLSNSAWNSACKFVPVADLGHYTFFTDGSGDGLYTLRSREAGFEQLMPPRGFSLHRYDLTSDAGRRQAREYLRRKLSKL